MHLRAHNGFFPQNLQYFFEGAFFLAAQEKGRVAVADYGIGVVYVCYPLAAKGVQEVGTL